MVIAFIVQTVNTGWDSWPACYFRLPPPTRFIDMLQVEKVIVSGSQTQGIINRKLAMACFILGHARTYLSRSSLHYRTSQGKNFNLLLSSSDTWKDWAAPTGVARGQCGAQQVLQEILIDYIQNGWYKMMQNAGERVEGKEWMWKASLQQHVLLPEARRIQRPDLTALSCSSKLRSWFASKQRCKPSTWRFLLQANNMTTSVVWHFFDTTNILFNEL